MPAVCRKVNHPCEFVYTEEERQKWMARQPREAKEKKYPHEIGSKCKSAAVENPKGSGKYEKYCAAHYKATHRCPMRCQAMIEYGSKAHNTLKACIKRRQCKKCPMAGSEYCKFHHDQGAHVSRSKTRVLSPATMRAKAHKGRGLPMAGRCRSSEFTAPSPAYHSPEE